MFNDTPEPDVISCKAGDKAGNFGEFGADILT